MDKIYRVFISSTFKDLQEERREIIQTLLELDCVPTGMEMFHASDDTQWELIKKVIDSCDYYIVIISGRYGSIDPKTQKSYTQMDKDIGELPFHQIDNLAKLQKFIELVEKKHVKYWRTPEELAKQVLLSIHKIVETHPRAGWIKGGKPTVVEKKNSSRHGDITWLTPGIMPKRIELSYSGLVEITNIILGSGLTSILNFFDLSHEDIKLGAAKIQIADGINIGGYNVKREKYSTSYRFFRPFSGVLTLEMDPEFWDSFYLRFERNFREKCLDNEQREEYNASGIREAGSIFSGACCAALSYMVNGMVKIAQIESTAAILRRYQSDDTVFFEGHRSVLFQSQKINTYFTTDLTSINQLVHFYKKDMSIRSERKSHSAYIDR